jgi:hypothetical protein
MVATIVLASVVAFITPLSAGAGNASASAITKSSAASTTKASAAAVKTAPLAGAGTWHNQTVDSNGMVGGHTSLALTPSGWHAISYYDNTNGSLKYTYKSVTVIAKTQTKITLNVSLSCLGYPYGGGQQ